MTSSDNDFAHQLRVAHHKYEDRNAEYIYVIDEFFYKYIYQNVRDALMDAAATGTHWNWAFKYLSSSHVKMWHEMQMSCYYLEDGYSIHDSIVCDPHFSWLLRNLEYSLSDDITAVRIHINENVDDIQSYNGIWAEWYYISPFIKHAHLPFQTP